MKIIYFLLIMIIIMLLILIMSIDQVNKNIIKFYLEFNSKSIDIQETIIDVHPGYKYKKIYKVKDIKSIKTKYILVHWPESQYFIGIENCYHTDPMENIDLNQAMFVSEEIYNKVMNNN